MIVINEVLSLLILGLCFYRAHKATRQTMLRVRWGFATLGASGFGCALAPFAWGAVPSTSTLILQAAIVLVLAAATPQWRYGPPPEAQTRPR